MIRRFVLSVAAAMGFIAVASPALADIYTYKDEKGVVYFTNIPNGDKRFRLIRREVTSPSDGSPTVGAARVAQLFMPAPADIQRYSNMIEAASRTHGVDAALVHAVITAESGYNPAALSKAGARGLMQLMPATAARYGVRNIHDPQENINGGVRYLRDLIAMFNGNIELAVAAYNAGENAVIRYGNKIPPFAETAHYVPKVLGFYRKFQSRLG
jgi:soluble lytic murein transglycosylase-like protein